MADRKAARADAARELSTAITHLHEVFARRRRGPRGWADIGFPDDRADLPERGDVRTLHGWEYQHLAWHAFCFDGTHSPTIRYFLPRLLEEWDRAPFDLEMLVSYMNECQWRQWPDREVRAIERFCLARFRVQLSAAFEQDGRDAVAEVMRLAAFMGISLDPYFRLWQADESPDATLHLALFVQDRTIGTWSCEHLLNEWSGLWGNEGVPPATMRGILDHILAPWVAQRLEAAFFQAATKREQQILSDSLVYLDVLRAMMESQ